ncbi:anaphase-promoting complex subunit 15B-like isoform X3 [Cydia pomonella]|uniref:anaphase-promoting complex subunit 15B-like isoform X3 n=1 Tax=Cydia pomonella TaxID=82600 RepID=UPI002ADD5A7F|nr:anaphase-promoting complex subunit 15B-like isoform X3 [Cydia pomonella]
MDIPFPETTPRFIDSKWFNADTPCDEDVDLTALEQSNQNWLSNIGQQYKVRAQLGKADPEPMEECESEEEEGNDESDESEESHDEDEEEDLHQTYPPPRNEPPQTMDLTDSSEPNMSDQSSLWP